MERQLTLRVPAELAAKLGRSARRLKRKRSEVVREALEQYLDSEPATRPVERVRDLLGSVASGKPDLGQRHREYLIDGCAVAVELLLDTAAFVALTDRDEETHADCVATLEGWTGPIVTTEAVLTETLYLVGPSWRDQKKALEFVLRGAFQLVPQSGKSLRRVAALMERYRNVPMDYADATLVALGEELETDWVFTLDRRGFATYRLGQRKPFQIMP